jgi:hypothetical protein
MIRRRCGVLAALAVLTAARALAAQEAEQDSLLGWDREVVAQLNLTQVTFDNWSQGGEDAVAWQVTAASRFDYEQEGYSWANSGKVAYGRTRLGDSDFRKSIDEIKVETVLTYKAADFLDPYVSASGLTQFTTGYQYEDTLKTAASDFFDPAYFTQSIGLGYTPSETFKTRMGLALKETITRDFNRYADDPDTPEVERTRVEGGVDSVTDLRKRFNEAVLLSSKLELFSNIEALRELDLNWESTLTAQVARYLNVNFSVRLLYDADVSTRRQLKQSLALGLTYTFLSD